VGGAGGIARLLTAPTMSDQPAERLFFYEEQATHEPPLCPVCGTRQRAEFHMVDLVHRTPESDRREMVFRVTHRCPNVRRHPRSRRPPRPEDLPRALRFAAPQPGDSSPTLTLRWLFRMTVVAPLYVLFALGALALALVGLAVVALVIWFIALGGQQMH
jgi:hypothetical protein